MAKLPTVDALPIPGARGPAQINVSTQNGLGALGQGLTALGHAMAKEQLKEDTLRAEDAFNRLQQQRLELTQGEDGFSNIKSYDVVSRPIYKEYNDRFNSAAEDIGKSLSNDEQKKMFRRRVDVSKLQFGTDLANHIQREKNVYAQEVFKGGKAVELENAASNWDQPGAVKFSIERTKRLIEQQADREGWAPDVEKAEQMRAQSDIHLSVISQAVSTDNPEYAKKYYEKNKKNIEGTEQPKIEELIRQGGIKILAQEFTDEVVLRGLDEKTALSKARKKYSGDEENAVVQSIKNRFNEIQQVKEDAEKSAGEQAWAIYAETRDFDKVPLDLLQNMKGKEREALRAYAEQETKGESVKTNYAVYYGLVKMAEDDPVRFKEENMLQYLPYLSEKHRDQLIKLQTDRTEIDYVATQTELAKRGAIAAGLDPKEEGKDNDKGRAISAFYDNLNRQTSAFQISKGRKPDDKELTEIIDKMVLDKVYVNEWFSDPQKPVSTLTKEELEDAYVEVEGKEVKLMDIPDKERVMIINKRTKLGLPITEEAIARSWLIMNGRL